MAGIPCCDRLADALKLRDMTAAELSRRSGIDKSSISRYLKGTHSPNSETLLAISSVLKVSPAWLLGVDAYSSGDNGVSPEKEISGIEADLLCHIIQTAGSVDNFANLCGIPQSTISTVLECGIENSDFSTIIKICQTLGISLDGLVSGKIVGFASFENSEIDLKKLTKTKLTKLIGYYQCLLDS